MIDAAANDDAAVFRLSDERALVATVDFFTPIVDDARTFGAIAAANAFSDVYAMGATPLFALNIVGWPRRAELLELLGAVLDGSAEVAARAGAFIIGGHSIDDEEPKYGLVVVGDVHPQRLLTNRGARPGDALVLTKPIGTGVLSTALKRELIDENGMADAIRSMTTLNDTAAAAIRAVGDGVHAATDVTGFGLLGHLRNMLTGSRAAAHITMTAVPFFPKSRDWGAAGCFPGGSERNAAAARTFTSFEDALDLVDRQLLSDAQTSGGLLIAVAPDARDRLLAELQARGTPAAAVVGAVTGGPPGTVTVTR